MAANAGATTLDLQRHCGWRSEKTAIKYTENTEERKRNICEKITGVMKGSKSQSTIPEKAGEKLIDESENVIVEQPSEEVITERPEQTKDTPLQSTKNKKECAYASGTRVITAPSPKSADGGQNVFNIQLSAGSNLTLNFS